MDGWMIAEQTNTWKSGQLNEQVGERMDGWAVGLDTEETLGQGARDTHSMTFLLHRLLSLGW